MLARQCIGKFLRGVTKFLDHTCQALLGGVPSMPQHAAPGQACSRTAATGMPFASVNTGPEAAAALELHNGVNK
jgi:hypothetical protein